MIYQVENSMRTFGFFRCAEEAEKRRLEVIQALKTLGDQNPEIIVTKIRSNWTDKPV